MDENYLFIFINNNYFMQKSFILLALFFTGAIDFSYSQTEKAAESVEIIKKPFKLIKHKNNTTSINIEFKDYYIDISTIEKFYSILQKELDAIEPMIGSQANAELAMIRITASNINQEQLNQILDKIGQSQYWPYGLLLSSFTMNTNFKQFPNQMKYRGVIGNIGATVNTPSFIPIQAQKKIANTTLILSDKENSTKRIEGSLIALDQAVEKDALENLISRIPESLQINYQYEENGVMHILNANGSIPRATINPKEKEIVYFNNMNAPICSFQFDAVSNVTSQKLQQIYQATVEDIVIILNANKNAFQGNKNTIIDNFVMLEKKKYPLNVNDNIASIAVSVKIMNPFQCIELDSALRSFRAVFKLIPINIAQKYTYAISSANSLDPVPNETQMIFKMPYALSLSQKISIYEAFEKLANDNQTNPQAFNAINDIEFTRKIDALSFDDFVKKVPFIIGQIDWNNPIYQNDVYKSITQISPESIAEINADANGVNFLPNSTIYFANKVKRENLEKAMAKNPKVLKKDYIEKADDEFNIYNAEGKQKVCLKADSIDFNGIVQIKFENSPYSMQAIYDVIGPEVIESMSRSAIDKQITAAKSIVNSGKWNISVEISGKIESVQKHIMQRIVALLNSYERIEKVEDNKQIIIPPAGIVNKVLIAGNSIDLGPIKINIENAPYTPKELCNSIGNGVIELINTNKVSESIATIMQSDKIGDKEVKIIIDSKIEGINEKIVNLISSFNKMYAPSRIRYVYTYGDSVTAFSDTKLAPVNHWKAMALIRNTKGDIGDGVHSSNAGNIFFSRKVAKDSIDKFVQACPEFAKYKSEMINKATLQYTLFTNNAVVKIRVEQSKDALFKKRVQEIIDYIESLNLDDNTARDYGYFVINRSISPDDVKNFTAKFGNLVLQVPTV